MPVRTCTTIGRIGRSTISCASALACLLLTGLVHAQETVAASPLHARLIGPSAQLTVDGALDEPVWQSAQEFDRFHEYEPKNGNAAPGELRTSVRLVIDQQSLVFGIRAWDTRPAEMRASLTRRDKVNQDQDFIGIWIDPSGHGRAAQFVRVSMAGVLSDGIYRGDEDTSDLGPDFPIDAAVKRLPDGYSMEVRWPLSSLRFPYTGGKTWRVMVERSVPHADGMLLLSTPLPTGALSRIAMLQNIDGMGETVTSVRDRKFLDIKPELTLRQTRERGAHGNARESAAALGVEISSRRRADWVFNATLNPDYSQIDIDEPTTAAASRIALSLPEKRGFFLESMDVLGLPLAAFYSRTVSDPEWGMRATWRAAHADATAMSLRDHEGGVVLRGSPYETAEYTQARTSSASLVRGRWHGDGLLLGGFASRRDYGPAGSNDVGGVDGQWTGKVDGGGQQQLAWLAMHSSTSAMFKPGAAARRGSYVWTKLTHSSPDWWNEAKFEAIGAGFMNDNGFVPQTGVLKTDLNLNRRLGAVQLPSLGLELYEFELHLGANEVRTLADAASEQPGKQIIARYLQPGIWFFGPRQTRLFVNAGFDQQRANPLGRLHDTPALHLGFESSPSPWLTSLEGEFALGRRLDIDADRVGRGGEAMLKAGLRFPLPRGLALEFDQRWNRVWVRGAEGRPGFSDSGWRSLAMLHFTAQDALRLLLQNTAAARYHGGGESLPPWAERGSHRSLLYRHLWRHGRSLALGVSRDRDHAEQTSSTALTLKLQWEI